MEKKDHVLLGAALTVGAVEGWLDEHVDPETGYVVDDTLAIEGAAADSKATGEAIAAVEAEIPAVDATLSTTGAAADAKKVGDELTDLKSAIRQGVEPIGNYGEFEVGGLNTDGTIKSSETFRVSRAEKLSFNYDATFTIASGYKWGYIPFKDNVAGSWVGWKTSSDTVTIPANTQFVIQIAKDPENYAAVTDITPFVNALKVTTYIYGNIGKIENEVFSSKTNLYTGEKMPTQQHSFDSKSLFRMYYSEGTAQDIEYMNDYLFVSFSETEEIRVYSVSTPSVVADLTIDTYHGTGMQFSDVYYDADDDFPLLYVGGDADNKINVVRIVNDNGTWSATSIKKLKLPTTDGYYLAPSICGNTLYTIGYKYPSNNAIYSGHANPMIIASYNLDVLTANEDDTYTPALVQKVEAPYMGITQGRKFYDGKLFVGFSETNGANAKIVAVDSKTGAISTVVTISSIVDTEQEGLCYRISSDRKIDWLVSSYWYVYDLTF